MSKKNYPRARRVGELLHREIAVLVRNGFRDPRLGLVTIASVVLSNDLSFAKIYVTVLEDDKLEESLKILNRASGFFRTKIAKQTSLRATPKLMFVYDKSIIEGNKIDRIISSI